MKIERKKVIIILLCLLIFVLIGFFIWNKQSKIEVVEEIKFEEIVKSIDDVQKSMALSYRDGEDAKLAEMSEDSLAAWEVFVDNYKNEQPEEYRATKDWDGKLLSILKHERKARELFLENNFEAAKVEKKQSDEIYKIIKEENGVLEISEEMLNFYDSLKKVVEADTKERILEELPNLKLRFTILKEIGVDGEYANLIENMEVRISELDRFLDGPDFKTAQIELELVFNEIYMDY